jgi:hypothetical protein
VVLSKESRLFQLEAMDSIIGIAGVALLTHILFFSNLPRKAKDFIHFCADFFI